MITSIKNLYSILQRQDKIKIWLLLAAMVLVSILETFGVGIIPVFLSMILNPEKLNQYPYVYDLAKQWGLLEQQRMIIGGCVVLLTIFFIKNCYIALVSYYKARVIFYIQHNFRTRLFRAYLFTSYAFHLNRNSADLLNKVNSEVRILVNKVLIPGLTLILNVLIVFSISLLLVFAEPIVSVISFTLLTFISWLFFRIVKKKTHEYGHQEKKYRALMVKHVVEALGSLKSIIVHGKRPFFFNIFSKSSQKTSKAGEFNLFANGLAKPFVETIAITGIVIIVLILFWLDKPTASITSILTLFGVAIIKIMPSLRQALNEYNDLRFNYMLIDPIYDDIKLLENKNFHLQKSLNVVSLPFREHIEFDNVSFMYENATTFAIDNINLCIPKGASVAFVGSTGAGKTTLVDLLLGLLYPVAGTIKVDGVSIHSNLPGWLLNVGYIPQEIYLIDDTIAKNVAFGVDKHQIDQEILMASIRSAYLEEWIAQLPEGLQTKVGNNGVRLSGGQKQRIGIARALYHKPQVLIMDEATSALDNTTEKNIMQAIDHLRNDYTIIMIAHRLTTIKNCDIIFYLQNGKIISYGTFDELAKTNEEFNKMSLSQM